MAVLNPSDEPISAEIRSSSSQRFSLFSSRFHANRRVRERTREEYPGIHGVFNRTVVNSYQAETFPDFFPPCPLPTAAAEAVGGFIGRLSGFLAPLARSDRQSPTTGSALDLM
jgi:hypothetical protein